METPTNILVIALTGKTPDVLLVSDTPEENEKYAMTKVAKLNDLFSMIKELSDKGKLLILVNSIGTNEIWTEFVTDVYLINTEIQFKSLSCKVDCTADDVFNTFLDVTGIEKNK